MFVLHTPTKLVLNAGNPSNESLFYVDPKNSSRAYIFDVGDGDVRTEGMGYGMMAALQMDKQVSQSVGNQ
jgi:hypothetical protein